MRSTIFFIAMLLFVSASQDLIPSEVETQLIELSKDPSSEAVFATMSMQLKTEGGFDKVLGLLNNLVNDGKKQLHRMNKMWRRTSSRCQVSAEMFHSRQDFFEHATAHAARRVANANANLGSAKDGLAGCVKSVSVYTTYLNDLIVRHKEEEDAQSKKNEYVQNAVNALKASISEITNWTPKGAALVQMSLKNIALGFAQVKGFELSLPTELLETAGSDHKVRRRLLEWAGMLKVQLLGWIANRDRKMAVQKQGHFFQRHAVAELINALKSAQNKLNQAVQRASESIKNNTKVHALYNKLRTQNSDLMNAEKKYCQVEETNFHSNEKRTKDAIALFREIRKYFVDHYKAVHSYIRAKYDSKKHH